VVGGAMLLMALVLRCDRSLSRLDADVYEGAPTPITAFMAPAKAAGFCFRFTSFRFRFPVVGRARATVICMVRGFGFG